MGRKIPLDETYFRLEGPDDTPVLLGSYSPAAKTYFWPRRRRCPITMEAVEDCELAREGTLYSWTFVTAPTLGSLEKDAGGGFGAAQVDLPEGVRIQGLLHGKMGDWTIGMPVRVVAHPVLQEGDDELCTIAFEAVGSSAGGSE
jgi:uncharacterized OB-fold protein